MRGHASWGGNSPNVIGISLSITRAVVVAASLAMQQRTQERWHIGNRQAVPLSISCQPRRIEEALRAPQCKAVSAAN